MTDRGLSSGDKTGLTCSLMASVCRFRFDVAESARVSAVSGEGRRKLRYDEFDSFAFGIEMPMSWHNSFVGS
jgi:hypothetical protein